MNEKTKILQRTFGLEMEYADVLKRNVEFPKGFSWDKIETIHNTDGTIGTFSGERGGEINTPPMYLNSEARENLKSLLKSLKDAGAVARRDLALQVHLDVKDLDVEELKRVFFLTYHTANILKEVCHEPPYSDEERYRPSPTLEFYKRMKDAKDFAGVRQVLENSSNKGWTRHFVNVSSYFVRGTVEFRLFNSTLDVWEVLSCVKFAYRFLDYALKHEEEDFKLLKTKEKFLKELKISYPLPKLPPTLIYFSGVKEQDKGQLLHKGVDLNNSLLKTLQENTGDKLTTVNPRMYSVEVRLKKDLVIYNNDEFHHVVYLLAVGEEKINFTGKAEFLEKYNDGTGEAQVAIMLILFKLKKYFGDNEYSRTMLEAYKAEMDVTFEKSRKASERICEMLRRSTYHLGTLNDALKEERDVFFQFDFYPKYRSTMGLIKKYSDYRGTFERLKTYYNGIPENTGSALSLSLVSTNPYLEMEKIASVGDKWFYKTQKGEAKLSAKQSGKEIASFPIPPDDLKVDDPRKLRVVRVNSSLLHQAQDIFIKKVEKTSGCRFAYLVFYDKYVIGGFGFDLPKLEDYDVWLLSDFSTNNKIPRLSKLILLVIKSREVRRSISRRMHLDVEACYTKVYTHAPVSMKYRSCFKLEKRESNHLLYTAELGTINGMEEVIKKYQTYLKK